MDYRAIDTHMFVPFLFEHFNISLYSVKVPPLTALLNTNPQSPHPPFAKSDFLKVSLSYFENHDANVVFYKTF